MDILKFVYSVWNYIEMSRVYLHNDEYFIFLFANEEGKSQILQNGPYTYNSRPLILRNWEKNFRFTLEMLRIVPLWVTLPGFPIYYCSEENLSRIAN